jgi:hypothetical protein
VFATSGPWLMVARFLAVRTPFTRVGCLEASVVKDIEYEVL